MTGRRSKKPTDYDVPLELVIPDQRGGEEKSKPRPKKPEDYGDCPCCTNQKVALIRQGDHLVWKQHWIMTWARTSRPCIASGIRYCDKPVRVTNYSETIHCHKKEVMT